MSPRSKLWSIALSLALSGCGGKVVIDGDSGAGAPGTSKAVLSTSATAEGLCSANANQNQPGAVFLHVASEGLSCAAPELPLDFCSTVEPGGPLVWEICIPIQPDLAPETLDFSTYGGYANFRVAPPDCNVTVVGFLQQGTITITSVDASKVSFSLAGTDQTVQGLEMKSDGTYEAQRCP